MKAENTAEAAENKGIHIVSDSAWKAMREERMRLLIAVYILGIGCIALSLLITQCCIDQIPRISPNTLSKQPSPPQGHQ